MKNLPKNMSEIDAPVQPKIDGPGKNKLTADNDEVKEEEPKKKEKAK